MINKPYIVIIDMRENNGRIVVMTDIDDRIAQFETFDEAEKAVLNNRMAQRFPVRYVNMDE